MQIDINDTVQAKESASIAKKIACNFCRTRKLRCNGEKPKCSSCVHYKRVCEYTAPRRTPGPKRLKKCIEERLNQVEQELMRSKSQLLDADLDGPASMKIRPSTSGSGLFDEDHMPYLLEVDGEKKADSTESAFGSMLNLNMDESLPPIEVQEELIEAFFSRDKDWHMKPINPIRFKMRMSSTPAQRPKLFLQYTVFCIGASLTQPQRFASPSSKMFYRRAKHYLEQAELASTPMDMLSLDYVQCMYFISYYEYANGLFCQAWISAGRASRAAQMQGLQTLDLGKMGSEPRMDSIDLDERRRSFWACVEADRMSTVCCGWSPIFRDEEIMCRIPIDDEKFAVGLPSETFPLKALHERPQVLGAYETSCSSYCIIYHILLGNVVNLSSVPENSSTDGDPDGPWWSRYHSYERVITGVQKNLSSHYGESMLLGFSSLSLGYWRLSLMYTTGMLALLRCGLEKIQKNNNPKQTFHLSPDQLRSQCIKYATEIFAIYRRFDDSDALFCDLLSCFPFYLSSRFLVAILATKEPQFSKLKVYVDYAVAKMSIMANNFFLAQCFRDKIIMHLHDLVGADTSDSMSKEEIPAPHTSAFMKSAHSLSEEDAYMGNMKHIPPSEIPYSLAMVSEGPLESIVSYPSRLVSEVERRPLEFLANDQLLGQSVEPPIVPLDDMSNASATSRSNASPSSSSNAASSAYDFNATRANSTGDTFELGKNDTSVPLVLSTASELETAPFDWDSQLNLEAILDGRWS